MARFAMVLLALAGLSMIAFSVNAATDLTKIDTDGDGMYSFAEMLVAYPDLGETTFNAVDVNGDGMLNEAELTAAIEAGVLPDMAG